MAIRLLRLGSLALAAFVCVALMVGTIVWVEDEPDILKGIAVAVSIVALLTVLSFAGLVHVARVTWKDVGVFALCALIPLYALLVNIQGALSVPDSIGIAFEPGTVISMLCSALAVVAGYLFVRLFRLPIVFAICVAIGSTIVGGAYLLGLFVPSVASIMLFGGWFSTQLLFAAGFLCALRLVDQQSPLFMQIAAGVIAVVLTALLLTAHSNTLVLGVAIAGALFLFLLWYAHTSRRTLYWPQVALVVVMLCAGLTNAQSFVAQSGIADVSIEVRPSVRLSTHVLLRQYEARPQTLFWGTGESFVKSWNMHRPESINRTPFWDTDFVTPSGTLIGFLITYGAIAVLVGMLACVHWCGRAIEYARSDAQPRHLRIDAALQAVLVLFGLVSLGMYAPNFAFITIWTLSTGVLLGIVVRRAEKPNVSYAPALVLLVLLCGCGGAIIHTATKQYAALREYATSKTFDGGVEAFEAAEAHMKASLSLKPLPHVARMLSARYEQEIRTAMTEEAELVDERRLIFAGWANSASVAASVALELDPNDYRNWIQLGDIKVFRALFEQNPDLIAEAINAYDKARSLAPQSPVPHFLSAQAAYLQGDFLFARTEVEKAIDLKPDYYDARVLQLNLNALP